MVAMIVNTPEMRSIEMTAGDKNQLVRDYIDLVVDKIVMSHDWDFALGQSDESIVAGQRDYVLGGENQDARNIFNIRYGSGTDDDGYNLLNKRKPADVDEWLNNRTTTGVHTWVPLQREGDLPKIRILDTPTDDTKVLRYRYWLSEVSFDVLPEGVFDSVVFAGVRELISPGLTGLFDRELKKAINKYQGHGGEDDPAKIDPQTVLLNNRRRYMQGYGGC